MSLGLKAWTTTLCATAAMSLPVHAQPNFDDPPSHSSAKLIAETDALTPGSSSTIAAVIDLDKNWHTYADSINDSGSRLLVNWSLPEGIEIGEPIWPAAHRHVQAGGVLDHTYDDQLVVLFPLDVASGVEIGSDAVISASLEWLVCDANQCVPQFAEASIELPVKRTNELGSDAPLIEKTRNEMGKLATGASSDAVMLSWEGDTLIAKNALGYELEFIPGPGCPPIDDLLETGYAEDGTLELAFDFDDNPKAEVVGWVRLIAPKGKRLPPIDHDLYLIRLQQGKGPARFIGEPR